MDLDTKKYLWFVDHLNKCRCCFEKFGHNEYQVEITEIIEKQFLELTQIELESSPNVSNKVCLKCTEELQSISSFRSNLITKQQQLQEFVVTSQNQIQNVNFEQVDIKTETQSCDEFKFESQYEGIENPELPLISLPTKICYSLRQRKTNKMSSTKSVSKEPRIDYSKRLIALKPQVIKKPKPKKNFPHCGTFFLDGGNLTKHIRRVHLKEKLLFCDFCDYGTLFRYGIENHVRTHLPKLFREKFSCDKCEFATIAPNRMITHLNKGNCSKKIKELKCKQSEIKRTCSECSKVFQYSGNLLNHIRRVHFKLNNFFCDICGYGSLFKHGIISHMKTHLKFVLIAPQVIKKPQVIKNSKPKKICPHCGTLFIDGGNLTKHIRRVHLKEKLLFCDSCDYGTLFRYGIQKHVRTHLPKLFREKFSCDKCEFVTIVHDLMINHLNKGNCSEEIKKLEKVQCHCGKEFNHISSLKIHIKYTHENQRNFICTVCAKGHTTGLRLREHMETHNKNRKRDIACDVCGKMFFNLRMLKMHKAYHKDPQFICEFEGCTKKFYQNTAFKGHKKTHIDQRDFACELCDKKYFLGIHLQRHILHFHKKLKISCELPGCSSKFARKETYRNHVMSHHKDLSKEKVQLLFKKIREMKQE